MKTELKLSIWQAVGLFAVSVANVALAALVARDAWNLWLVPMVPGALALTMWHGLALMFLLRGGAESITPRAIAGLRTDTSDVDDVKATAFDLGRNVLLLSLVYGLS